MDYNMKIYLMFDWVDFGVMFRVYKNFGPSKFLFSIDIQIAWLNIWMQLIRKSN
jgi:hypothetical protein